MENYVTLLGQEKYYFPKQKPTIDSKERHVQKATVGSLPREN